MAEDSVGVPGSAVPGLLGYPSGNPVTRSTVSASFLLLDTAKPVSLVLAKKRSRGLEIHLLPSTRGPAAIWDQTALCRGAVLCVVGL